MFLYYHKYSMFLIKGSLTRNRKRFIKQMKSSFSYQTDQKYITSLYALELWMARITIGLDYCQPWWQNYHKNLKKGKHWTCSPPALTYTINACLHDSVLDWPGNGGRRAPFWTFQSFSYRGQNLTYLICTTWCIRIAAGFEIEFLVEFS